MLCLTLLDIHLFPDMGTWPNSGIFFLLEFLGNISSFSAEFEAGRMWMNTAGNYHLEASAWEEHQLRAEK